MPYAANGQISTDAFEGAVEITQEQYEAALAGMMDGRMVSVDDGFAVIDPPEPEPAPEPEPLPPSIPQQMTFAQLLIGLVAENWISEAEGEAWLTGVVPDAVKALIATLPEGQRFAALARASRPSVVMRSDPLVAAMADMQDKSQVEMDDFFSTYAAI